MEHGIPGNDRRSSRKVETLIAHWCVDRVEAFPGIWGNDRMESDMDALMAMECSGDCWERCVGCLGNCTRLREAENLGNQLHPLFRLTRGEEQSWHERGDFGVR